MAVSKRSSDNPVDPTLVTAADYETDVRPYIARLEQRVQELEEALREAIQIDESGANGEWEKLLDAGKQA